MPKYSYGYYDTSANVGLTAGTLIGLIPTTIIIIGMWMFYISCSRDAIPSTTGITLNRGAIITNIVIICIASVLIIIGLLLVLATGSMTTRSYWGRNVYSMAMGLIVFIFIVIVIFLVMAIIYYVKLLKLTRIIRDTINTGRYCGCLPMYPLIINFVLAAFNLFSLFGVVTTGGVGYKIISLIAALALVASFVSTTLSLFSLRTRLEGMR